MMEISAAEAIEKAREWGAEAPLAPLNLAYEDCEPPENVARNVRQTLESKYASIINLLDMAHDRTVSVFGFAPSIHQTWDRHEGDVFACNGAHKWLLEKGVTPTYALLWDADPVMVRFVEPNPETKFIVASRCHRDVFKALDGCQVYVWHAMGDKCIDDLLSEYRRAEPMLGHGSAAVTTAMMLAHNMGYRKMKVFGADSSFQQGKDTHAVPSIVREDEIVVWMDGRKFHTTACFAGQIEDFRLVGPALRGSGCDIEIHGDGLLPHCARIHGFKVHP